MHGPAFDHCIRCHTVIQRLNAAVFACQLIRKLRLAARISGCLRVIIGGFAVFTVRAVFAVFAVFARLAVKGTALLRCSKRSIHSFGNTLYVLTPRIILIFQIDKLIPTYSTEHRCVRSCIPLHQREEVRD